MRRWGRTWVAVPVAIAATLAVAVAPAAASSNDELRGDQWGLDAVNADAAGAVSTGAGVLVAVLDSGVAASHPDLVGNIVDGPDLVTGDGDPADENGHGTHVAGIIAAHANNGIGIAGLAPGATILAIRVLDADDEGDSNTVARGIDAAVAAGARVVNLSLSASGFVDQLTPTSPVVVAIERAASAGVVVVAAAGNDALPLCEQPIVRQRTLCVGAVDDTLNRSSFSNYGVRVDLVAPGGSTTRGVVSTVPSGYAQLSGTSQATPFVSATAALLIARGMSGPQAIDRILATTRDLGLPGTDTTFGAGLLDAQAALGAPNLPPPVAPVDLAATTAAPVHAKAKPVRATLRATAPRALAVATLLRHGLGVRCTTSRPGRCAATLKDAAHRTLASGSRATRAGRPATLTIRVTRAGKRLLKKGRRIAATLRVTGPGGTIATRKVALRP